MATMTALPRTASSSSSTSTINNSSKIKSPLMLEKLQSHSHSSSIIHNSAATSFNTDVRIPLGTKITLPGSGKGILRFIGEVHSKNGVFAGVELVGDLISKGKNSGEFEDIQYFKTSIPKSGLFLPYYKLLQVNANLYFNILKKRNSLPNSISNVSISSPLLSSTTNSSITTNNTSPILNSSSSLNSPLNNSREVSPTLISNSSKIFRRHSSLPRSEFDLTPSKKGKLSPSGKAISNSNILHNYNTNNNTNSTRSNSISSFSANALGTAASSASSTTTANANTNSNNNLPPLSSASTLHSNRSSPPNPTNDSFAYLNNLKRVSTSSNSSAISAMLITNSSNSNLSTPNNTSINSKLEKEYDNLIKNYNKSNLINEELNNKIKIYEKQLEERTNILNELNKTVIDLLAREMEPTEKELEITQARVAKYK